MTYPEIPRQLICKDKKELHEFIGTDITDTLEHRFYEILKLQPFIKDSVDAAVYILKIFNNARYIYSLLSKESDPLLYYRKYLQIAEDDYTDERLRSHLSAATMALVYNWIYVHLANNETIRDFNNMLEANFTGEDNCVPKEAKNVFIALIAAKKYPTRLKEDDFDVRTLEEIIDDYEIPLQDLTDGIDYILEVIDDDERQHEYFIRDLVERIEKDEEFLVSDIAKRTIQKLKGRLNSMRSKADEENDIDFNCILSNEEVDTLWGSPAQIPEKYAPRLENPEIQNHLEWIADKRKSTKILITLWEIMEGKRKPKLLLMPLCAALEAGVITRRPSSEEYKIVFEDYEIKSNTSFNDWIDTGSFTKYKQGTTRRVYEELVEIFNEIKEEEADSE